MWRRYENSNMIRKVNRALNHKVYYKSVFQILNNLMSTKISTLSKPEDIKSKIYVLLTPRSNISQ